jgi:hypothetical protein
MALQQQAQKCNRSCHWTQDWYNTFCLDLEAYGQSIIAFCVNQNDSLLKHQRCVVWGYTSKQKLSDRRFIKQLADRNYFMLGFRFEQKNKLQKVWCERLTITMYIHTIPLIDEASMKFAVLLTAFATKLLQAA